MGLALGAGRTAGAIFAATTTLVLLDATVAAGRELLRRRTGVDLIAVLAMATALALGEQLAGAIVAVMLTGGGALEAHAAARARRELTRLLERAPRRAHRLRDGAVEELELSGVEAGDVLLVKPGEVIPTDGILLSEAAVLDESTLTGEARPVRRAAGDKLQSGATSTGEAITLRATATAETSTFAAIVRLVRAAEGSKAPFVRLADRYALWFLLLTLGVAGGAYLWSGDAVRALAVLVVATPCPLILAAPAAILGGVSRAARHGILVKGGGPLEALAGARVLLLDKTGTLTAGRPRVVSVESFDSFAPDELARLAASVEQLSSHPFAPAILEEARARGVAASFPEHAAEELGAGIAGRVDGRQVAIGLLSFVAPQGPLPAQVRALRTRVAIEGTSPVYVAVDGQLAGALVLADPIRTEAPRTLRALRREGLARIHMVTGDHPDIAELVGDAVGVDRVFAERSPEEKVAVIQQAKAEGSTIMIGDGVNDAPALALADVGVAMGARGASAASEAADVVLTSDRLEGLLLAVRIARRTRGIALQSVLVGMGLSLVAMGAAAAGLLPPVAGAILQEGIDVLVILNALRALGGGGLVRRPLPGHERLAEELSRTHQRLRARVQELGVLASRLGEQEPSVARDELHRARDFLLDELLPHEHQEQATAYPAIARLLPGEDPTGPLTSTHHEIARLTRLFGRLVGELAPGGPLPSELRELHRALYGLHAILVLHFDQEDELYGLLSGAPA